MQASQRFAPAHTSQAAFSQRLSQSTLVQKLSASLTVVEQTGSLQSLVGSPGMRVCPGRQLLKQISTVGVDVGIDVGVEVGIDVGVEVGAVVPPMAVGASEQKKDCKHSADRHVSSRLNESKACKARNVQLTGASVLPLPLPPLDMRMRIVGACVRPKGVHPVGASVLPLPLLFGARGALVRLGLMPPLLDSS